MYVSSALNAEIRDRVTKAITINGIRKTGTAVIFLGGANIFITAIRLRCLFRGIRILNADT